MSSEINPREVLRMFFRHKGKFIACVFAVFAVAVVGTALMKPRYRSEAMLFVRLGRENVALDPTASIGSGSVVAVPSMREDEINSVVEILLSRSLAERIVDAFGPAALLGESSGPAGTLVKTTAPDDAAQQSRATQSSLAGASTVVEWWQRAFPARPPDPREDAVELVQRRLSVYAPKKSMIIHIGFEGHTPEQSQAVVRKVIELYLEDHVRLNRTPGSHDFFSEQTDESRNRLNAAEKELRDLKNSTGMASVVEQRVILVERIGRLEDSLLTTTAELRTYDAELAAIREKLDRLPETRVTQRVSGLPNVAADGMRQQLYALQLKEQELKSTFTSEARQVKEIRRQIEEARAILASEEYDRTQSTNAADPTYAQLHLTLHAKETVAASLRAKVTAVEGQLSEARTSLAKLNDDEMRLAQLQREVELQEESYRRYAANLELARIDQALKMERISNIGVAQAATYSSQPVRPQRRVNLAIGLAAALASGLMLVLACEYFDRSIRTEQDVEQRLGLAALVSIPCLDAVAPHAQGGSKQHDLAQR